MELLKDAGALTLANHGRHFNWDVAPQKIALELILLARSCPEIHEEFLAHLADSEPQQHSQAAALQSDTLQSAALEVLADHQQMITKKKVVQLNYCVPARPTSEHRPFYPHIWAEMVHTGRAPEAVFEEWRSELRDTMPDLQKPLLRSKLNDLRRSFFLFLRNAAGKFDDVENWELGERTCIAILNIYCVVTPGLSGSEQQLKAATEVAKQKGMVNVAAILKEMKDSRPLTYEPNRGRGRGNYSAFRGRGFGANFRGRGGQPQQPQH